MKKKVIIDCDTGVDDAQALLLALLTDQVDIIAITCVAGNVAAIDAARNTVRVLHAVDVTDIPVFVGASKPLVPIPALETVHTDPGKYHGNDGLGDVPHATTGNPPYQKIIQTENACVALCRLISQYPGEVTLVALGPLTNVAMAIRLDDSFSSKLKDIFIMGGAIYAQGNVTVTGEFNIVTDPEAATVVLEEAACPTYLMPWETCCKHGLDWEWHKQWVSQETKVMRFIHQISERTCQLDRFTWKTLYCPPDVVAMAYAIRSDFSLKQVEHFCMVETGRSPMTRGQLIVDWKDLLKKSRRVTICLEWDIKVFKELLESMKH